MRVEIDGVVYVPASEAFANAKDIERALISLWWGDTTGMDPELYERLRIELKVQVSDSFDSVTGDPLQDVIASIAAASTTSHG